MTIPLLASAVLLLASLSFYLRSKLLDARAMMQWVDHREAALSPVIQCVQAIHLADAPRPAITDLTGPALPEAEEWTVNGEKVNPAPRKSPHYYDTGNRSSGEFRNQTEAEETRRALIQPLRERYVELAAWEIENPAPNALA